MDIQKQKARELADRGRCVQQADGAWLVFSLNSTNRYRVVLNGMNPSTGAMNVHTCTCPHYELVQEPCKHIRACLSVLRQDASDREHGHEPRARVPQGEPAKYQRPTYAQPDWNAYTEAQCNEKPEFLALLSDLCATVTEPERQPGKGRPPVPLAAQVFGACFKVWSGLSGRRFMSDMREATEQGYVGEPVHFNSIARFFEDDGSTALLKELVNTSAMPLNGLETQFAADSTGFSGCRFARWYDQKYGRMHQEHVWVKAHAMIGTHTNCITAAEVLGDDSGDSPQLPQLVKRTAIGFKIGEVSTDKAYTSQENFDAVQAVGGTLYSAFRVNTTGGVGGLFQEMYHRFCLAKDEYLGHYHLRSNAESTFSGVKRLFGDSVRSKTPTAMRNEVYAKFICYNLTCIIHAAYELGMDLGISGSKSQVEPKILKFPGL
jgi:transposase